MQCHQPRALELHTVIASVLIGLKVRRLARLNTGLRRERADRNFRNAGSHYGDYAKWDQCERMLMHLFDLCGCLCGSFSYLALQFFILFDRNSLDR